MLTELKKAIANAANRYFIAGWMAAETHYGIEDRVENSAAMVEAMNKTLRPLRESMGSHE
jgi:hypothetical protein